MRRCRAQGSPSEKTAKSPPSDAAPRARPGRLRAEPQSPAAQRVSADAPSPLGERPFLQNWHRAAACSFLGQTHAGEEEGAPPFFFAAGVLLPSEDSSLFSLLLCSEGGNVTASWSCGRFVVGSIGGIPPSQAVQIAPTQKGRSKQQSKGQPGRGLKRRQPNQRIASLCRDTGRELRKGARLACL